MFCWCLPAEADQSVGVEGAVATQAVVIDCDLYADNEGHSSLITEQPSCRDLLCQEPVP